MVMVKSDHKVIRTYCIEESVANDAKELSREMKERGYELSLSAEIDKFLKRLTNRKRKELSSLPTGIK